MVLTKALWAAALTGSRMPQTDNAPPRDRTSSAMLERMEKADKAFHNVLTDIRNRSAWEDTFVDALCEPPETFTFAFMCNDLSVLDLSLSVEMQIRSESRGRLPCRPSEYW